MFPTSPIVFLVAIILIIIISWKIFKSVLKTALTVLGLLLIVGIIFGVVLVADAKDFQETIRNEPTTYILAENTTVYSAFSAQGLNAYDKEIISTQDAQNILMLSEKEQKKLDNKIIVFSFESLNWSDFNESPQETFSQITDEEIRATVFEIAFLRTAATQGIVTIFRGVREKTIQILPKTPIVRILQFAPKKITTKIQEEGKDQFSKINETITSKLAFIKNKTNQSTVA